MSNYPPTPAFGGGFTMARPPFPLPQKVNSSFYLAKTSAAHLSPVSPHSTRLLPQPTDMHPPSTTVPAQKSGAVQSSAAEAVSEGDREEGEVSDVEQESAEQEPVGTMSNTNWQLNGLARNVYGTVTHVQSKENEQLRNMNHAELQPTSSTAPHSRNQVISNGNVPERGNIPRREPQTPKEPSNIHLQEELRKRAQAAVLNLLPLKVTFKDFVDEGINPLILRQVFERIGLPIPEEFADISLKGSSHPVAQNAVAAKIHTSKEITRSVLQERLRMQEQILKEQEEQKKRAQEQKLKEEHERRLKEEEQRKKEEQERMFREEQEKKLREEQERKKREDEAKQQEEAIAIRKKQEEEAEAARKKEEELRQELKAKKEILQKKFEEMRLPAKPPTPAVVAPSYASLPSRVSEAQLFPPPPYVPQPAIASNIMIPGLLLDRTDMFPRALETPMTAPTPSKPYPNQPILQESSVESTATRSETDDLAMKDATDRNLDIRSIVRKKRPVAADFDTEPNIPPLQKRRFGSLRGGEFVIELTDDEDDEATESDDTRAFYGSQSEFTGASRASKSPPGSVGASSQLERNGRSPPTRTSSAVNGTIDPAKQLQDTEEKIRELRRTIQQMQEKKRKPLGTGTPSNTGTPARSTTPSMIPGIRGATPPVTSTQPLSVSPQNSHLPTQAPPKQPHTDTSPETTIPSFSTTSTAHDSKGDKEIDGKKAEQVVDGVNGLQLDAAQSTDERKVVEQVQEAGMSVTKEINMGENYSQPSPSVSTQKKLDEAERLRMLLLSKRKALEARPTPTPPPPSTSTELQQTSNGANDIESTINNTAGIAEESQPIENTISAPVEMSLDQPPSEDLRADSESPPYEPSLEIGRKHSESPPYEPSLGPEDTVLPDERMDSDDAEEGEIVEGVAMDVDSSDEEGQVEEREYLTDENLASEHMAQSNHISTAIDSPISQGAMGNLQGNLPDASSPQKEAPATSSSETTANVNKTEGLPIERSSPTATHGKVIPNVFTPYESPLRQFRSFRYHPQYLDIVKGGWRSLTFSHRINPEKPFCVYEISGGKCNDPTCESQHFRQITVSDDEILVELGSVMEGDTEAVRDNYRDGLRELITSMRTRKVNDFETVATEISRYRSRFFNDPTRVVRLTKS